MSVGARLVNNQSRRVRPAEWRRRTTAMQVRHVLAWPWCVCAIRLTHPTNSRESGQRPAAFGMLREYRNAPPGRRGRLRAGRHATPKATSCPEYRDSASDVIAGSRAEAAAGRKGLPMTWRSREAWRAAVSACAASHAAAWVVGLRAGFAPPADGLDQWASPSDLGEQNSVSKRYVPEDMPGTQDLDNNGTWSEDGNHGPVWYPSEVAPGWAPYSNGYWNYVGPYKELHMD